MYYNCEYEIVSKIIFNLKTILNMSFLDYMWDKTDIKSMISSKLSCFFDKLRLWGLKLKIGGLLSVMSWIF